ncbi:MAG TPA: type III-A CRISPR-associated RAMP protein Csm5, partial [Arcobacter sp.]|nr:type III-A CRISPR-associated RAMP protein Csm5 [Arcobacter sp.]
MPRYKITTLSPIHISSGEEYEKNFNMLYSNGFIYIYDEFKIAQFFIDKNIEIPTNLDTLKQRIEKFKHEIIASNLHIRKIESEFTRIDKSLLENISTAGKPIITGSSLKGSLRTAILDSITNNTDGWKNVVQNFRNKNFDEKRFKAKFDNDFANIFKYLKVSDSLNDLDTKIYKTINM